MRILVTACPFFGHVNTVLPMALAAQRAGHEVVLATGSDFAAHVSSRGLAVWPAGPTAAEAGMPESVAWFRRTGTQRAQDLLGPAMEWQPDLVLSEELELGGAVVAALTGARFAVHGVGVVATGDLEQYTAELLEFGQAWGVANLVEVYRDAVHVSICPPSLRPPTARAHGVHPLRPAFGEPIAGEQLPPELSALPYASTVHVTLGTVFHQRRPGVLEAAVSALRELPVNLVVTVGPDVDPERLGPQPPHVLVERYLPHALLLPRCDLVVSQGGAGILLGAAAHGLPQLLLPQGADQFDNSAAAQRAGFAIALDSTDATAQTITRAVDELCTDARYAAAAHAVRREIEAMPTADEVMATLAAGETAGAAS